MPTRFRIAVRQGHRSKAPGYLIMNTVWFLYSLIDLIEYLSKNYCDYASFIDGLATKIFSYKVLFLLAESTRTRSVQSLFFFSLIVVFLQIIMILHKKHLTATWVTEFHSNTFLDVRRLMLLFFLLLLLLFKIVFIKLY